MNKTITLAAERFQRLTLTYLSKTCGKQNAFEFVAYPFQKFVNIWPLKNINLMNNVVNLNRYHEIRILHRLKKIHFTWDIKWPSTWPRCQWHVNDWCCKWVQNQQLFENSSYFTHHTCVISKINFLLETKNQFASRRFFICLDNRTVNSKSYLVDDKFHALSFLLLLYFFFFSWRFGT